MISNLPPHIELAAAELEASKANSDFMIEWISTPHASLYDSQISALRSYRDAAERVVENMIAEHIAAISPGPVNEPPAEHIDFPHWPGTLFGCVACEDEMAAAAEAQYDTREHGEWL